MSKIYFLKIVQTWKNANFFLKKNAQCARANCCLWAASSLKKRQFRAKSKRDLVTPNCPCAAPLCADVRQLGPVLAGWVGVGAEEVEGELGGGGAEGAAQRAGLWNEECKTELGKRLYAKLIRNCPKSKLVLGATHGQIYFANYTE